MAAGTLAYSSDLIKYAVNKKLSAGCTITMYVTFSDNGSSLAFALLTWESGGKTYSAEIRDGAAITSTSRTSVGTYKIPGGRAGTLKSITVGYNGTAESGVGQSGIVDFEYDGKEKWKPLELLLDARAGLIS